MATKIPWWTYLIIGVAMSIISFFSDRDSLRLFIYIGYLFGVVGVIKLVLKLFSEKQKKHTVHHQQHSQHGHQAAHPAQHAYYHPHVQRPRRQVQQHVCPRCRSPIQTTDNFCSGCGQQLRR